MKSAPFEQFIKHLLDQTAAADALRDLATRNIPIQNSGLMKAVEAILLEESITAQFDYNGYESAEQKLSVTSKLRWCGFGTARCESSRNQAQPFSTSH